MMDEFNPRFKQALRNSRHLSEEIVNRN
jgi:hypothetical protein